MFRKIFLYTIGLAVILMATLTVFGFLYQDKIIESVKGEVNKALDAEIQVREMEFSFISHFPLASVNLLGVTGFESKEYSTTPDTLFSFQRIALSFNVWDVIHENWVLNSISLEEGFTRVKINREGTGNYEILKSDTSESSSFFLNLQRVNFEECTIGFQDYRTKSAYEFFFPKLIAKGTFTNTEISTALFGETKVNRLILDGTSYLEGEYGKVDIGIQLNMDSGFFQIFRGFITLRKRYQFNVKGTSQSNSYQYTFTATNLDLQESETLVPAKYITFNKKYDTKGRANITLDLSKNDKDSHPIIVGTFDVQEGWVENRENKKRVEIDYANGRFDLGKKAASSTTQIWITDLLLRTNEGQVKGSLSISNLDKPWFRTELTGKLDLTELTSLINREAFSMTGSADFDLKLTGVLQSTDTITLEDIRKLQGSALINLANTGCKFPDLPAIEGVNATIKLNQEVLTIEDFKGVVSNSPTTGEVKVTNWLDYLSDSTQTISVVANVHTERFNSSEWITESDQPEPFSFPERVNVDCWFECADFVHEETQLKNLSTDLNMNPLGLNLSNTSFGAYGGNWRLTLKMKQIPQKFSYDLSLKMVEVDIRNLLQTYNNFGQSAVKYTQIRGNISTVANLSFETNRFFDVDLSSIVSKGDFVLVNGQLIENELLISIPEQIESNKVIDLFINLDAFEKRLHDVRFDTISNSFAISNSKFYVPKMHISSSALQIDLNGEHGFDNEMDYYISFNLKEVLTKKKKMVDIYGYMEDDNRGNRMIFLHVYTVKGELKVDLDKDGAKKHRQQRANQDIEVTKSLLKEELGLFKNDSTVVVKKRDVKFDYQLDFGEFAHDSTNKDSTSVSGDSLNIFGIKKKKKTKKEKKDFEEWEFEDDDY